MTAALAPGKSHSVAGNAAAKAPRLALLGTGTVGGAFVARHQRLRSAGLSLPALGLIANSRDARACGEDADAAFRGVRMSSRQRGSVQLDAAAFLRGDIVIDATASDGVAARHPEWLARGVHVVTANKLGCGSTLARADAITAAQVIGRAQYGDSATVGAGLPVLRSMRALVRGGDRIVAIEGVLSGSLAWLFNHYDGVRPFSALVREARDAGYTEPDPRLDLSGEDVRRKLLILARAAGITLDGDDVEVDSLVPPSLAGLPCDALDAQLVALDTPLRQRFLQARRDNARLRFVGRFTSRGASVGLCALPVDHALCGGDGSDNRVAITSCRYSAQPLVIQGPGAGAEVTAAALLDDALRIANRMHR